MRDIQKQRERSRRYRRRKRIEKYGAHAADMDMRGRHGNHARGDRNAKSKGGRFVTSHGYVALRVDPQHPHAWGANSRLRYAYEHIIVAESVLGRALRDDEIVHHRNGDKTDNSPANLEVMTVSDHASEHDRRRGRDNKGRFPPADLRVREMPEVRRGL